MYPGLCSPTGGSYPRHNLHDDGSHDYAPQEDNNLDNYDDDDDDGSSNSMDHQHSASDAIARAKQSEQTYEETGDYDEETSTATRREVFQWRILSTQKLRQLLHLCQREESGAAVWSRVVLEPGC